MRQFVKTGVFLPERLSFLFVGAAEMAGCIVFDELRRVGIELFSDEPEVAERIQLLYSEILTDEIGHVGYCASRCSAGERAIMRRIYPLIGRMFARQTAEIRLLIDRRRWAPVSTDPSTSQNLPPDWTTKPISLPTPEAGPLPLDARTARSGHSRPDSAERARKRRITPRSERSR